MVNCEKGQRCGKSCIRADYECHLPDDDSPRRRPGPRTKPPNCDKGQPCGMACIPMHKTCHVDEPGYRGRGQPEPDYPPSGSCGRGPEPDYPPSSRYGSGQHEHF